MEPRFLALLPRKHRRRCAYLFRAVRFFKLSPEGILQAGQEVRQ